MASLVKSVLAIIAPKGKPSRTGLARTGTFQPSSTAFLPPPQYREHLTDIFANRQQLDSRALMKDMMKSDPDVSATFNSYLTLADTKTIIVVRDLESNIDREATKQVYSILQALTHRYDYTQKFQLKPSFCELSEHMRTMVMMRGAVAGELVFNKQFIPDQVRMVDPVTLQWNENPSGSGIYKPTQNVGGQLVSLDEPNFFMRYYRRDPTTIYPYSPFISAINTIAARQQVINDLYRIMNVTGYPRIDITVMEEVVTKSAPVNVREDASLLKDYITARMQEIANIFAALRADQAFIHTDATQAKIVNDKNPGMGVDISKIIEVLNAQNQAGLKTMSTVIGRGTSGVNTSTVEARIAAMNADALNGPIADMWSSILSFALQISGYQGFVEVCFRPAEMRPATELEPQLMIKANRLQTDLSLGLISDDEYHLEMYGRIQPDFAPALSGTGFMVAAEASGVGAGTGGDPSPNADPLGRSVTAPASKTVKSNAVKKPGGAGKYALEMAFAEMARLVTLQ